MRVNKTFARAIRIFMKLIERKIKYTLLAILKYFSKLTQKNN